MNSIKVQRAPIFFIIASVIVFLYFELATNLLFLKLTGGYLIKVWIPPLLLFIYAFSKKIMSGNSVLSISLLNLMLLLSYSIFGLIAMLYNETLYFAIKYYLIMIAPIGLYFVIIESFKDNRDINLLIKILYFCGFLLSIYTFYIQWIAGISSGEITYSIITSAGNEVSLSEASFGTKEEGFSRGLNNYEAGKYCGMLAPFVLYSILLYFKSNKNTKYIYLVISFVMLYQFLQASSRSALLAISAGTVILLVCLYRDDKKIRSKIVLFSFFIILAGITYLYNYFHVILRFLALFNFLGIPTLNDFLYIYGLYTTPSGAIAFDPHYVSIFESIEAFLQSPFLGSGYIFTEHVLREHNRYLFILASSGLLTLIPYVLFFTGLTFLTGKAIKKYSRLNSPMVNYGYLFYACNISFLVKLMNEGMEAFYYWIFFAFATAWIRNCKREQSAIRRIL